MAYQKITLKDKENRLVKLIKLKEDIEFDPENKHPESKRMIIAYKKFLALSDEQRLAVIQGWEKYYADLKDTPIYALFQEQREALRANNFAKVKDLALQAKKMRENNHHAVLTKPSSIDPWEFNQGYVRAYLDYEKEINELKNELADTVEEKEVWNK